MKQNTGSGIAALPRNRPWLLFIVCVVFLCFFSVLKSGFVWDDHIALVENPHYRGLSLSNLHWMFTTSLNANYHPIAWLTLGFDYLVWGMNPVGYHLTNLLLHLVNACLFFLLLAALLKSAPRAGEDRPDPWVQRGALAGALLFAIHPLRVETVSWVSTRGDLVCAFFLLLTVLAYLKMTRAGQGTKQRQWLLLSLLLFTLSLLSRAWGITLPVVLLMVDVYPLRRIRAGTLRAKEARALFLEKIPFCLLAVGAAIAALLAKQVAMVGMSQHGILDRIVQSAYGLAFYPFKTILPIRLSPFYALESDFDPLAPRYLIGALAAGAITILVVAVARRRPWAMTAWFCYAVTVSPLLGLVQSGPQIAADRYTYLACMPFAVLCGAAVVRLWNRMSSGPAGVRMGYLLGSGFVLYLLCMFILSTFQIRIWRDDRSRLDQIIHLNPADAASHYERGLVRMKKGDFSGAIGDYTSAIRLDPGQAKAYYNRGVIRRYQGDLPRAMADFNSAIRIRPDYPEVYAHRGLLHRDRQARDKAVEDLRHALRICPDDWKYRESAKKDLEDLLRGERP